MDNGVVRAASIVIVAACICVAVVQAFGCKVVSRKIEKAFIR